jgi:hypothetical protein
VVIAGIFETGFFLNGDQDGDSEGKTVKAGEYCTMDGTRSPSMRLGCPHVAQEWWKLEFFYESIPRSFQGPESEGLG